MMSRVRIIIIGGGLSGFTLAYLLEKRKMDVTILEASSRIGGRIQTISGVLGTPLELGATWFSDVHVNLMTLLNELGIQKYPQFSGGISLFQTKSFEPPQQFYVPAADTPSYRIAGGTQALIEVLASKLTPGVVHLEKRAISVVESAAGITVETTGGELFHGDIVISCIPPQLVAERISITPGLPASISGMLPLVQTWMAGAVKFTIEYDEPFWRHNGYSGMLYSHAGIVMEMYDHTNFEQNKFGFTGFLNSGAATYSPELRKELVLQQLVALMGSHASRAVSYFDKIWNDDLVVAGKPLAMRPHQFNGDPLFHVPYLNGKFIFCGTETAGQFPGYMEGAVIAAKTVAGMI
jgi:monoamine oxidase